ncbi:MAG: hypothetical protein PIR02_19060 [Microbacterium enclense]
MSHSESPESVFVGPLSVDWTIVQFLEWIGADDDRCHDERLRGILNAIDRALLSDALRPQGSVVTLVRSLAIRASAEPRVGERTLGEFVGVREPATSVPSPVGVLVPA